MGHTYVIRAPTRESIAAEYPFFGASAILELSSERPDWLTEPSWLRTLVAHVDAGDSYMWYRLIE